MQEGVRGAQLDQLDPGGSPGLPLGILPESDLLASQVLRVRTILPSLSSP